jgi:hypothetical protein
MREGKRAGKRSERQQKTRFDAKKSKKNQKNIEDVFGSKKKDS